MINRVRSVTWSMSLSMAEIRRDMRWTWPRRGSSWEPPLNPDCFTGNKRCASCIRRKGFLAYRSKIIPVSRIVACIWMSPVISSRKRRWWSYWTSCLIINWIRFICIWRMPVVGVSRWINTRNWLRTWLSVRNPIGRNGGMERIASICRKELRGHMAVILRKKISVRSWITLRLGILI